MQANGNPEEIMQFASTLERYVTTLEDETNRLSSAFNHLGQSWNDQKRANFEETYRNLVNALNNFKGNASEQIPYLRTMANDLSTYLGR